MLPLVDYASEEEEEDQVPAAPAGSIVAKSAPRSITPTAANTIIKKNKVIYAPVVPQSEDTEVEEVKVEEVKVEEKVEAVRGQKRSAEQPLLEDAEDLSSADTFTDSTSPRPPPRDIPPIASTSTSKTTTTLPFVPHRVARKKPLNKVMDALPAASNTTTTTTTATTISTTTTLSSRKKRNFGAGESLFPLGDELTAPPVVTAQDELYVQQRMLQRKEQEEWERRTEQEPPINAVTEPYPKTDSSTPSHSTGQQSFWDPSQVDEVARTRLGISRQELASYQQQHQQQQQQQHPEESGIAITEIRRSQQTYMTPQERANTQLEITPNLSNATFRKRHNIKWLAGQAQNLDSYIQEKHAEGARKKQQTGSKYGF